MTDCQIRNFVPNGIKVFARKSVILFLIPLRDMARYVVSKVMYVFVLLSLSSVLYDPYQTSCPYNSATSHFPNNTKRRLKARIGAGSAFFNVYQRTLQGSSM